MAAFILRRVLWMFLTLFIISIVTFVLIDVAPGSALSVELSRLASVGGRVSTEQVASLEEQYGVHDPLHVKYAKWAGGFVQGDFGQSFSLRAPVSELIWGRLGMTLLLTVTSLLVAWLIAIPIGVYSATHRYSLPDYVITLIQFIGVAIPEFLLALLVLVFASRVLGADIGGLYSIEYRNAPWSIDKFIDLMAHLWIPVVVIAAGSTAWLTRVMRANLLDVLNQQYIQTARAKGVKEVKVIWKHAVRNAIHPLIMALGTALPTLISGEAIVSIVLNLPTTGPMFIDALVNQDMYLAATLLMFLSMLLLVGNLLADILLAWVDPRVRTAG